LINELYLYFRKTYLLSENELLRFKLYELKSDKMSKFHTFCPLSSEIQDSDETNDMASAWNACPTGKKYKGSVKFIHFNVQSKIGPRYCNLNDSDVSNSKKQQQRAQTSPHQAAKYGKCTS